MQSFSVAGSEEEGMKDLRSPLAKARDDFFETEQGKRLIEQPGAFGRYLHNRLEAAFIAGWTAADEHLSYPEIKKGA